MCGTDYNCILKLIPWDLHLDACLTCSEHNATGSELQRRRGMAIRQEAVFYSMLWKACCKLLSVLA